MNTKFFPQDPIPYLNEETQVYKGSRFTVHRPLLKTKEGQERPYEIVKHPGAVVILPFLTDEVILMIENKRPAVNKTLLELPAGTLEKGEDPSVTANRELIEESGYQATHMTPLLQFYATPGFTNEMMWGFSAKELNFVGQDLDENEEINVIEIPFTEALEKVKKGQICDAKSMVMLLYAALNHVGR